MINIYPYWEGVNVTNSASDILARYNNFKAAYPNVRIIVGEQGEPSGGTALNEICVSQGSISNQLYFLQTVIPMERSNNIPYFYFEPYDQQWKTNENAGPWRPIGGFTMPTEQEAQPRKLPPGRLPAESG